MTPLRVGIIGLGVGAAHIPGYERAEGCEVVAACDLDAERLDEVGRAHPGLRLIEDAGELLDDPEIDVVSIASFDDHHFEQVKRALEHDKHVFVEKPICQTEEHARELHAVLAERPHLRLSSNLPLRASARFTELKGLIDKGRLGRLYYLEGDYVYGRLWKLRDGWRGDLERYSVFLGGGIHMVDLLLWLTGDRVVRVSAMGNRIASEGSKFRFDDMVVALLEFESGVVAKVSANFGSVHPHFHDVRVFGTEGTYLNSLEAGTLWTPGPEEEQPQRERLESAYPGYDKGDLIPSFIDSIAGRGPAILGAEDVFRTVAVCFAVERAAESGEPAEVASFA